MSGNRKFVDTNVLVYAHDVTAAAKHDRARGSWRSYGTPEEAASAFRYCKNSTSPQRA
jgi:predicted nucleic acid-binding protein